MKNKAIFLDRDGTINIDKNYLHKAEDFEFIQGVPETIRRFNELHYKVIVITNQSGIARGYYAEEDVKCLHRYMDEQLKYYKAHIDAYYYCPHLPEAAVEEYRVDCNCRKPKSGMFKKAIQDFNIDPKQSWAIGDKERDLIPGIELGMHVMLADEGWNIRIEKELK